MLRVVLSVLVLAATVSVATPASAGDLTPDAAYALVVRATWSREAPPRPEEVAVARSVLEIQAARESSQARWIYALGRAAAMEADQSSGDAARAKRKEALERFTRAVELQPGSADYQFWLGSASFDRVDDVGMLSKMSLASDGRKAFEKAIEIDPANIPARVGLSQFYLNAPSIVGGGVDKARAEGEALLRLKDDVGKFQGDMVLGGIAAHEKNWAEMSRWLTSAETAPGDGANPAAAMATHAWQLLNGKKDPQAAAPVVERYVRVAPAGDLSALFLDAEVKRQLGHCDQALAGYDQVLAKFAGARGSRWGAAVCREQLGQKDAARKDYEEYVRRFPKDDRSKEAKVALKRLSGT